MAKFIAMANFTLGVEGKSPDGARELPILRPTSQNAAHLRRISPPDYVWGATTTPAAALHRGDTHCGGVWVEIYINRDAIDEFTALRTPSRELVSQYHPRCHFFKILSPAKVIKPLSNFELFENRKSSRACRDF